LADARLPASKLQSFAALHAAAAGARPPTLRSRVLACGWPPRLPTAVQQQRARAARARPASALAAVRPRHWAERRGRLRPAPREAARRCSDEGRGSRRRR